MSGDNIYTKFGCSLFSSCLATTLVHPFDDYIEYFNVNKQR